MTWQHQLILCRTMASAINNAYISVTILIHMCYMICLYGSNNSVLSNNGFYGRMSHSLPKEERCAVWHNSLISVIFLIYMSHGPQLEERCAMTHSYVWHKSIRPMTWLLYMSHGPSLEEKCAMTSSYVWHASLMRVTWLPHMCDVNYNHESWPSSGGNVWHDSRICETRLTHTYDWTHFTWVTAFDWSKGMLWLNNTCDMNL